MEAYLGKRIKLIDRYAKERDRLKVAISVPSGKRVLLSAGEHNELIRAVIEEFAPRFVPGGKLIYAGDTADKTGHFDTRLISF